MYFFDVGEVFCIMSNITVVYVTLKFSMTGVFNDIRNQKMMMMMHRPLRCILLGHTVVKCQQSFLLEQW